MRAVSNCLYMAPLNTAYRHRTELRFPCTAPLPVHHPPPLYTLPIHPGTPSVPRQCRPTPRVCGRVRTEKDAAAMENSGNLISHEPLGVYTAKYTVNYDAVLEN